MVGLLLLQLTRYENQTVLDRLSRGLNGSVPVSGRLTVKKLNGFDFAFLAKPGQLEQSETAT